MLFFSFFSTVPFNSFMMEYFMNGKMEIACLKMPQVVVLLFQIRVSLDFQTIILLLRKIGAILLQSKKIEDYVCHKKAARECFE